MEQSILDIAQSLFPMPFLIFVGIVTIIMTIFFAAMLFQNISISIILTIPILMFFSLVLNILPPWTITIPLIFIIPKIISHITRKKDQSNYNEKYKDTTEHWKPKDGIFK